MSHERRKLSSDEEELLVRIYSTTGPDVYSGKSFDELSAETGWDRAKLTRIDQRLTHEGYTRQFVHCEFTLNYDGIDYVEHLLNRHRSLLKKAGTVAVSAATGGAAKMGFDLATEWLKHHLHL